MLKLTTKRTYGGLAALFSTELRHLSSNLEKPLANECLSYLGAKGYIDLTSNEYKKRWDESQIAESKLIKAESFARAGGSDKAKHKHTMVNKKILVRDRIKELIDQDSEFWELGTLVGHQDDLPCSGVVLGIGKISDHYCVILANDATVKGGTMYPISVQKQLRGQQIAHQLRLPAIYLTDSGGAFLPLQAEIFPDKHHGGRVFYNEALMGSEGIPQVSVVLGNCTAGAAYIPTMSDDAIIAQGSGTVFLGGPPLVKAATGEVVSAEDLGGAQLHCRTSGCTDYYAKNEKEALNYCKEVVSSLGHFPRLQQENRTVGDLRYAPDELRGIAGSKLQETDFIHQLLARTLDDGKFYEFRELYGSSIVCGFGFISGYRIGAIVATGPEIDFRSAQKACQFVQMCALRKRPLVFFQKSSQEPSGDTTSENLRATSQLMKAIASADIPKITFNIGDSRGSAFYCLCGPPFDPLFYFSWPNAEIEEPLTGRSLSSFEAASTLCVDEIVLPKDTRKVLTNVLRCLPNIDEDIGQTNMIKFY